MTKPPRTLKAYVDWNRDIVVRKIDYVLLQLYHSIINDLYKEIQIILDTYKKN